MNSQSSPRIAKALAVADAFMATFNVRDWKAHFETLNFPHIRIASGAVQVWNTPEHLQEYEAHWTGRIEPDWSYSAWDSRDLKSSVAKPFQQHSRFCEVRRGKLLPQRVLWMTHSISYAINYII